ncbi:MAG: radical SAM protein [Endomicrobiaceae bacterium]|jgi:MoaA/NifB/PqqE/SkfB family radical SAM enzyme|nr:radical SAM protein [Endomicrobiaceae bacterium]MDD3729422.1 radical SAM protein [Endomicrobiaceae bacterium]MDD4165889.1 radical SAM protein [Endomicrobiaceae bacterium]
MEYLNQILEICKKIKGFHDIVNETQYDQSGAYYERYAKRVVVELIQKLNNDGRFDDVRQLYLDIDNYVPKANKKLKNILLNEYEISQRIVYLKSFPRHIQLVMTLQCNLNCIMCNDKHENIFISDKELDDLIEIMPYLQFLTLRGGEVFYDKRTGRILDEAYKNDVKLTVITNGLLLDDLIIDKLLRVAGGIVFSIDSPFKETYEAIRIGGKFEKLKENLKKIYQARKIKKYNLYLTLNMVIMRKNYNEIEDMLYFAKEYGFDAVVLAPVEGNVKGIDENFFEKDLDNECIEKMAVKRYYFEQIANKLGIHLENRIPKNIKYYTEQNFKQNIKNEVPNTSFKSNFNQKINEKQLFCYAPFRQMFKAIDYSNPLCCCDINVVKNKQEENMTDNSILNSWNSSNMIFYRKKILEHNYTNCANVCLNSNYDNFEGKRILKWEI